MSLLVPSGQAFLTGLCSLPAIAYPGNMPRSVTVPGFSSFHPPAILFGLCFFDSVDQLTSTHEKTICRQIKSLSYSLDPLTQEAVNRPAGYLVS